MENLGNSLDSQPPANAESAWQRITKRRGRKLGKAPVAVVFVHGAYHTEESSKFVEELLQSEGVPTHSVRLPSERVFKSTDVPYTYMDDIGKDITAVVDGKEEYFMTLNDYASKIAYDIMQKEFQRVVIAGKSLGGDSAARVPGMLGRRAKVEELAFLSAPLHASTVASLAKRDFPKVWNRQQIDMGTAQRNTQQYLNGIIPYKNLNRDFRVPDGEWGLTDFDRSVAPAVFYNRCHPEIADWATGQLRMQWRSFYEPQLPAWPNVPSTFYFGEHDMVTTEPWCRARARLIGADFITIKGADHSMHLSQPEQTAEHLLEQVRRSY